MSDDTKNIKSFVDYW